MCGIFGVWNFKGVRGHHLHRASSLLAHRGPDDEGFLVETDGVPVPFAGSHTARPTQRHLPDDLPAHRSLLHRRLSIIDLTNAAHQPMQRAGNQIFIVFNGEVYNHAELARRHDLRLDTSSDTEVILALYEKYGTDAFALMRGMWALAILDLPRRRLILSRDRFGIKPLYWCVRGGGIAFSSELRPMFELPGISHSWSEKSLLQYITFGATADPDESFAEGIQNLAPGTFATYDIDTDRFRTEPYYELPRAGAPAHPVDFEHRFRASITEHMVADVDVGSCLSGGIDSSLIVAEAAHRVHTPFRTFTCAFPGEDIDESSFARRLLEVVSNAEPHFITPTSDDLIADMDDLVIHQERPIGSASIYAQYAVMKLVSQTGVKVVLDGQGADEVFGGYYPFGGAFLLSLLRQGRFRTASREFAALKSRFHPRMEVAIMRAGYYALPQWLQSSFRKSQRIGFDLLPDYRREAAQGLVGPQRGSADFDELTRRSIRFGLKELLHYEDRNSMRFGVESRVPFLDHRLVEWSLMAPSSLKIRNGWTKWPLRRALDQRGAGQNAWRVDKLGFVAPQERWRKEITATMDVGAGSVAADLFNRDALRRIFATDLPRNEDRTAFWRIFFLLKWLETHNVDIS